MKRVIAAALVVLAAAAVGASNLKTAAELARRTDYAGARRAAAADTASLRGKSLNDALLFLARLETDVPRAEGLYRRVLADGPSRESAAAALELAKISYARGDYRGAVDLLAADHGDRSGGDREEAAYFRGLSWKQLGERARARAELSTVDRGDFEPWSILALADIEMDEGRLAQAISLYERAAKTEAHPVARFGLGECLERMGDRERAAETYRALARELPRSLEAARAVEKLALLSRARQEPPPGGTPEGGEGGEGRSVAGALSADRYTIQFGAFGSRDNATIAARKLEGLVPAVRIESVEMDGRIWHRVRAGLYENRSTAERDLARIRETLGVSGAVVPLK